MYEKIEELLGCPKSTLESVRQDFLGWWVEMLRVLTCGSQSDTCQWRIWHMGACSTWSRPFTVRTV
jgi:hypothetical protein